MRFIPIFAALAVANAKLLIDYRGGDPVSKLGTVDMEHQNLGDHVAAGTGGSNVFIKPENDSKLGVPCLHYKRAPHYRRAEVKNLQHNTLSANKKYFIGYTLRLSHARSGLVIFQWKKQDKDAAPKQNIPFHLEFEGANKLTLGYTTPGSNGSNRTAIWDGTFSTGSSMDNVHKIGLAIDTASDCNGKLELWLDGKKEFSRSNLCTWTGDTYPKWGMYRGEAAAGDDSDPAGHTFNSYVYRVQFSDSSKAEVAESAGW
ncbi:hypothetical protein EXIGLDRAFT_725416 [Exidia glandulosa HHB12029]|uniref:Polysaccharide lyase family 14 protein n=1 Tax=Exidia glandulosa HHB12029 TaxID=1314781 RepID=A0A165E281_EXIGL|nr:hypothetical protein EXIGLDRAFT_725416 [Exidia glandulosa HHB12029]